MCSLAPRAAAPGFGSATAFLDRQRGVVAAAMAPAASSRRHNAGEPTTRRGRATEASAAAPARKRGRHGVVDDPAAAAASSSALRSRMDKELVALQGLVKRAKLLPRSATPAAEKKPVPSPRRSEAPPVVSSSAAKRTTTASESQPKAATEAAPAKNPIALEVPNNKQRPADAPAAAKQKHHPVQSQPAAAAAKTEVPKLAGAIVVWNSSAAREEFRQMLREMEKAALPDETVYPEEMEELGIPFEFLVTRTWKQAMLDYHAKKAELVGV